MASLMVKVSFTDYMLEARIFVKLGRLYGEDLDLSSWWRILVTKLAVSGIIDLVTDMATDAEISMRPNTFDILPPFLYFS